MLEFLTMGIRELLGQASGPSGFGSSFGRSVVDNGSELGRILYVGHGKDKLATKSGSRIFDDATQMRAAGFELFCSDPTKLQAEDSSVLSIHCRAVSMALATHLGMFCARFFRNENNKSDFNRAMGKATAEKLNESSSEVTVEMFKRYAYMSLPSALKFVNKDIPGEGDLLGFYLNEVAKNCTAYSIGFQRSGAQGFAVLSVALMEQTISKFEEALAKFGW